MLNLVVIGDSIAKGYGSTDYKTDSFRRGTDAEYIRETLRRRHRLQLGYYKYACEKMFGKPVSHVFIYSFALGDAVEIYDL